MAALRESATRDKHSLDMELRSIGQSDSMLVSLFGEKKAVEMSESMWEPSKFHQYREGFFGPNRNAKLTETLAVGAFSALLRLGVQDFISKMFLTVDNIGEKVRKTVPSNAFIQPYSGTFRAGVPSRVGAGAEFPEVNVQGFGQLVENWKFGEIIAYQQELLDDDQTGALQDKVKDLGVNMANYEELAFAAVLSDTTITFGPMSFAPGTYTDPDTTTGVYQSSGNRTNRPASFGAIGLNTLKVARQTMFLMKQPDGQILNINPNAVVYHPVDEQLVDILSKSPTFPGPAQTNTAYGTPTGAPAQGIINPVQGMYTYHMCRYLNYNLSTNGGAWFVTEAGAPHVTWQERTGLRVVQEAPNTGQGFNRMITRWRADKRGAMFMYVGGARFVYEGNSGA
jgi:hypothetical protein